LTRLEPADSIVGSLAPSDRRAVGDERASQERTQCSCN
jgi:hypothetical protein